MAAIDEPPPEPALALDMLIEMHARRVLEQARGELMLGLLDGLPIDMVDLVADVVIAPAPGRAGKRKVVAAELELRQRCRAAPDRLVASSGTCGSGAGASGSRLLTITQRA